ncbi:hypothetical protein D3C81_1394930 [compost metagenome]
MRRFHQRGEQVRRANLGAARRPHRRRRERRAHPCRLQPLAHARREPGPTAQVMRQAVDSGEQRMPDGIDIEFIAPQDRQQVAFAQFEQLDQPVLDLDVPVGTGLAEAGRLGQRAGAMGVQASQERGIVAGSHEGEMAMDAKKRPARGRPGLTQARSFQLSAWMMLPSLYDQVIFS